MITKVIYYDKESRITEVYVFGILVYKEVDKAKAYELAATK